MAVMKRAIATVTKPNYQPTCPTCQVPAIITMREGKPVCLTCGTQVQLR
jgi:hypothetical protein